MSLLEHHDGREYQRLSNSRVTERSGEIKAWPCLLSASSGCLGALTCSAAIRVEAVKQCWKELGWERASNSHLESEMALYIHVNGMRHTSDLFTEQIQTFICFFGECLPHWSVLELNQGIQGIRVILLVQSWRRKQFGWARLAAGYWGTLCPFPDKYLSLRDH